MSLHLPDGREIRLGKRVLGRGAEGQVLELADTPDLCAKIYLEPVPDLRQRLVALMRTEPAEWGGDHSEHLHVAWPRQPLVDETGSTRGFLMGLVQGQSLTRLFDPHDRAVAVEEPTWRVIIGVAARAARLLSKLHSAGIVVGDISPANILVSPSGHVTLIDCDTVQFTDPNTNILYRCSKLTPEYAPPSLNGSASHPLSPSDDAFGLAILICQLLMEGDHPFEGIPRNPLDFDAAAPDNIRLQNNRIVLPERFEQIPDAIPASVLPPEVFSLARTCFGEGHRNPAARPLPAAWETALEHAGFELMGCRVNDRHLYHSSQAYCVWCARMAQGFDDRYPPAHVPPRIVIPQLSRQQQPAWPRQDQPGPQYRQPPAPRPMGPPPKRASSSNSSSAGTVFAVVVIILAVIILLGVLL